MKSYTNCLSLFEVSAQRRICCLIPGILRTSDTSKPHNLLLSQSSSDNASFAGKAAGVCSQAPPVAVNPRFSRLVQGRHGDLSLQDHAPGPTKKQLNDCDNAQVRTASSNQVRAPVTQSSVPILLKRACFRPVIVTRPMSLCHAQAVVPLAHPPQFNPVFFDPGQIHPEKSQRLH